jgi:hypothetical protein
MVDREATAQRIRAILADLDDVVEKPIVGGGLGFMVGGNLLCAVSSKGLTVRVGRDAKPAVLAESNVRPHLVGGRETAAFVIVDQRGFSSDEALAAWIDRGLRFVATLG